MLSNPARETLGRPIHRKPLVETPFRKVAEQALAAFRTLRMEVERKVRAGDLTPKAAREEVSKAAASLREELSRQSRNYSPVTTVFADRLADGITKRFESRKHRSLEELQRETNELLRRALIEQQINARVAELESSTHARPIAGGTPVTSIDRMIDFYERSESTGDEAGAEWARRQLEKLRARVLDPEEELRIDRATRKTDRVNERLVAATLADLEGRVDAEIEVFVTHALERADATDLVAAFVMARRAEDPASRTWVRRILEAVEQFPEAALTTLTTWEARERTTEAEAARLHAEYAIVLAEAEAKLHGLKGPTDAELARQSRISTRPFSAPSVQSEGFLGGSVSGNEMLNASEPQADIDALSA